MVTQDGYDGFGQDAAHAGVNRLQVSEPALSLREKIDLAQWICSIEAEKESDSVEYLAAMAFLLSQLPRPESREE